MSENGRESLGRSEGKGERGRASEIVREGVRMCVCERQTWGWVVDSDEVRG